MLKKVAVIGGVVAVAALGLGGAAWAGSNSSAPQAGTASAQVTPAVPAVATLSTSATVSTTATRAGHVAKTGQAGKANGKRGKRAHLAVRLEKVSHAQWVSKDGKSGAFVTHDAVRGTVAAVTPTSITIKATDGTTEAFTVNGSTKVHVRGQAKGGISTIAQVKVGDDAGVLGIGATSRTATHVIDRGAPGARTAATPTPTTSAPATS